MVGRRWFWILGVALWTQAVHAQIAVTDAYGRAVTLPAPAARIAPAGPPAEVLAYVVAPDLLAGWARKQPESTLRWVDDRSKTLPVMGHLTGWEGEPDYSVWKNAKVDLFLDYGSVGGRFETLAASVQQGTGIPYAVFDGRMENIPASLRAMGKLTGREARAEDLAKTAERILARAAQNAGKGPTLYIARNADGRASTVPRSQHAEIYAVAGAVNVATKEENISDDDLKAWKPDVIIVMDPAFVANARNAPWTQMPAVKNKRMFVPPAAPWSWMGGPPSVNRLLGLVWLNAALAEKPDWAAAKKEAGEVYKQFFGRALTTSELNALFTQPAS
ncbi:MAG: ABC transporter substrate-binding protein [Rhodospirillaceae bacterium]|nr:ABC transporter substrate-binding protein [Rhodospirillaceae bacterium]